MMNTAMDLPFPAARRVAFWLWMLCTLIVLMVAVGGITRITESGLSIVEWKPLTGALAPRTPEQWNAEFDRYKATPQFQKFDQEHPTGMTLADFQNIYFWEHVHRQLGRFIGLAYALPLLVFLALRQIPKPWIPRLLIGFALLCFQGFLGWFMVKSGLVDKPYVSHFRLAAHLSTALFLLVYLLWLVLDLLPFRTHRHTNYVSAAPLRRLTIAFLALLSLQIVYGAFTAGLRAGYMHNTYPLMSGRFFPGEALPFALSKLFNDPSAVQFVHRHLGLLVVIAAFALWAVAIRQRLMIRQKLAFNLLVITASLQFILGIYTLISGMNIFIAVAHQVCACFLLSAAVTALHELIEPKTVTSLRS